MRTILSWAALAVLALLALVAAAALATAKPADPDLYPAAATGGVDAYMVHGAWTASLLVPTEALVPAAAANRGWTRISCDMRKPWAFALLPGDRPLADETEAVRLTLSAPGLRRMAERLEKSFGGKRTSVGPNTWKSAEPLLRNRLCGVWVGELLGAAGVPVTPVLDVLPAGLAQDLVWRTGAVKLDRPRSPR